MAAEAVAAEGTSAETETVGESGMGGQQMRLSEPEEHSQATKETAAAVVAAMDGVRCAMPR